MSRFVFSSLTPRLRRSLAAALLAGTMLSGLGLGALAEAATTPAQPPAAVQTVAQIAPTAPARTLPDFADLVARVRPAVVSITTELKPQNDSGDAVLTPFGLMRPDRPQAVEAKGSGFLIDAQGTIVTNNHVVEHARSVSVTLSDGTNLPARIVGRDARTDIAVLKVQAGHPLPYIELGDSAKVRPGEWVVAVGNPFGLGGSVTAGIVSASGRDIGAGPYDDFIQIDAPINHGNSGGPLFTQDGRVVGVNAAILSPNDGSVGIGFAIPSDMVRQVVADLVAHGTVTRGFLGVETQPVTAAMAKALHLPQADGKSSNAKEAGALVAQVESDSPAAKAGIEAGDVIRGLAGKPIGNPHDLAMAVAAAKPDSKADLTLLRNGKSQTVSVTLGTLKNDDVASTGGGTNADQPSVGIALAPITPQVRSRLDLPSHVHGAVVAQVRPDSPAAQAGVRAGDVVVGVGDAKVSSAPEAANAIRTEARADHAVALRILRDGQTAFVAIDLSHAGSGNGDSTNNG